MGLYAADIGPADPPGHRPRACLYEPYNAVVALTIEGLLRIPGLDLRPVAGARGGSTPIRWVHVSELEDPTPWLRGGELLLTTGIGVGGTPARQRAYLRRLIDAGLSGLGFGTGFSFRKIPKALAEAAEREGFPVFEVPYEVPFIAITEAVFTRLLAEQYEVLSRSLDAEHALTKAVLEGEGPPGIVSALTEAMGGWALLLDLKGTTIAAVPERARRHAASVRAALAVHRSEGPRFSLSLVDRGHHVAVQPVVVQGRVEAFLALGKKEALNQFDRIVSSHAVALLAIELAKARAVSEAERRLKGEVLDQLIDGSLHGREARVRLERLGFDPSRPITALAFGDAGESERLIVACEEVLAQAPGGFLTSIRDDAVLAVVQPQVEGFLGGLRDAVAARASGTVQVGSSRPIRLDDLGEGVREAGYALQVCRSEGRLMAEFRDLGTYQLLLSLQDPDALRTFAASVLGPLDRYDALQGGELVPSLRAFLDKNARWEAAASALYVHRHTLRYRMRKVEELTGRDLSAARDRMEFFLALRARELLASEGSSGPPSSAPTARVGS
jgi:PucR family transcriptional regulator, purine catabolism regulatory protein